MSASKLAPPNVTTLAERKAAEAKRRTLAADAAAGELGDYGRARGGQFVVFGS